MKYLTLLGFFIFSISLSAQDQEDIRIYRSAMQQGEQVVFGDRSVKFKEVVSDSRCPKDVTCIWAGEAKVLIEVFEKNRFVEEKLVVINSGNVPLNFSAEDISYSISSLELLPYPSSKNKTSGQDYTLKIQVNEEY